MKQKNLYHLTYKIVTINSIRIPKQNIKNNKKNTLTPTPRILYHSLHVLPLNCVLLQYK